MNKLAKDRNIGIDLLRGLSVLYIVGFWHMFNYTQAFPDYNNSFTYRLALIILGAFVFVSGYLIGGKGVIISKTHILDFYKKRLLRIYPLYIVAICLFTFLHLSSVITSIKAALMVSMFIQPAPRTLWFITMLMVFYVISPLLINLSKTDKVSRLIVYCLAFIALLMVYSYCTGLLDVRIVMYFPSFFLGVFFANNAAGRTITKNRFFSLVMVVSTVLLSFFETQNDQLNSLIKIPMILCCSYFLFKSVKGLSISSKKVCRAILVLSYSSYCMYLFHHPVYMVLKKIYFPEVYVYQLAYLVLFCLPCIFCFSFFIQKTFDLTVAALARKSDERKNALSQS